MTTTYRKEICYDRETRDFAMYLDGELVGFARTHHEAEIALDQLVFELMSHGATATASALDGGADADEMAADVVGMLVEVAQTEIAHTNAPDCPCDECMRTSYAYLNTLAPMATDVNALVIRGEDPTRVSAVLAHREEVDFRQRCLLCGGDHSAEDCPRIHPIDATPLLEEADAVIGRLYCPNCLGNHLLQDCPLKRGDHATEADVLLSQTASHPGPDCSCPDCARAAERLIVDAFMTRLRFDAGLICQFRGETHDSAACWQHRPVLLIPRVCGNCQGRHSIQACDEIRAALFAT